VTDFTFTKSEGAQVPFAYAADCKLKPAVSSYSLHGTNLRFLKEIKTFIGHIGSAVSGDIELSNNDQDMKITIVGYCGYTSLGGKNFDGKLGREVLPETLLPVTFLFAANPEKANESQPTPEKTVLVEFYHGEYSCPTSVHVYQGKYYLPLIPSANISKANGGAGTGKLKGTTTWNAIRIIQLDDGPSLG